MFSVFSTFLIVAYVFWIRGWVFLDGVFSDTEAVCFLSWKLVLNTTSGLHDSPNLNLC